MVFGASSQRVAAETGLDCASFDTIQRRRWVWVLDELEMIVGHKPVAKGACVNAA
jgi:hypothetical protein